MIAISAEVDTTKLDAALQVAMRWSKHPETVLDRTAYAIVVRAIEETPVVSQATIDAELGTGSYSPKKRKNLLPRVAGKRLPRRVYFGTKNIAVTRMFSAKAGQTNTMPLAAAIIQASVLNPVQTAARGGYSNYNMRTGMRYARAQSPFKGKTRQAGRAAMRAAVHRMIAARHSSTGFLRLGWIEVKKALRMQNYQDMAGSGVDEMSKGEVRRTVSPGLYVLEIVNTIGTKGSNPTALARYNRALLQYGGPALQRAVDAEGETKLAYYAEREAEKMAREFNAV